MLKIYLARHGQDEDNASGILNGQRDTPLTSIGITQAENLADQIECSGLNFQAILSSPLKRAYTTAQIVAKKLAMPKPEPIDLLKERTFGKFDGMKMADIPKIFEGDLIVTEKTNYILHPEGGETFPQLLERGEKVLNLVDSRFTDGNVLLVAHGDIGKMIYAKYYNLDWKEVLTLFHFGNSDLILLSPESKPEDVHVFKNEQFNN